MTARKKPAAEPISARRQSGPPLLKDSAAEAIAHFLATLDGESCIDLYDMVLRQVEEPLLKEVLEYTHHNQSHAATMLGLNRGTLRKKLRQYGLISESESESDSVQSKKKSRQPHTNPSKKSARRKR
jgi:Fis family transcriptional regulator